MAKKSTAEILDFIKKSQNTTSYFRLNDVNIPIPLKYSDNFDEFIDDFSAFQDDSKIYYKIKAYNLANPKKQIGDIEPINVSCDFYVNGSTKPINHELYIMPPFLQIMKKAQKGDLNFTSEDKKKAISHFTDKALKRYLRVTKKVERAKKEYPDLQFDISLNRSYINQLNKLHCQYILANIEEKIKKVAAKTAVELKSFTSDSKKSLIGIKDISSIMAADFLSKKHISTAAKQKSYNIYNKIKPQLRRAALKTLVAGVITTSGLCLLNKSDKQEDKVKDNIENPDLKNSFAYPNISANDIDIMARTIFGEARGLDEQGQKAVAYSIINRWLSGKYGKNISEVCLKNNQFSCWNKDDPNYATINEVTMENKNFSEIYELAQSVCSNKNHDNTLGARCYLTENCLNDTQKCPDWAKKYRKLGKVGAHVFFDDIEKLDNLPYSKELFDQREEKLSQSLQDLMDQNIDKSLSGFTKLEKLGVDDAEVSSYYALACLYKAFSSNAKDDTSIKKSLKLCSKTLKAKTQFSLKANYIAGLSHTFSGDSEMAIKNFNQVQVSEPNNLLMKYLINNIQTITNSKDLSPELKKDKMRNLALDAIHKGKSKTFNDFYKVQKQIKANQKTM